MGRTAQSAWILRLFVVASCALAPMSTHATATAQGVALDAAAGCIVADLDIALTTSGATTESWLPTTLSGPIGGGSNATALTNYSGPPVHFSIPLSPQPPPNTLIGAYANVGDAVPTAANTAEFFVYYNCTTRQVLLSCFGAYGSCPQTALQAATLLASRIPTLGIWSLPVTALLVGLAGTLALRRRRG